MTRPVVVVSSLHRFAPENLETSPLSMRIRETSAGQEGEGGICRLWLFSFWFWSVFLCTWRTCRFLLRAPSSIVSYPVLSFLPPFKKKLRPCSCLYTWYAPHWPLRIGRDRNCWTFCWPKFYFFFRVLLERGEATSNIGSQRKHISGPDASARAHTHRYIRCM